MRKAMISFILLLYFAMPALAQKGLPETGEIDKADLLMTDCEFDKGAEAVKLIDWASIYFNGTTFHPAIFGIVYERRIRIKILKEKGLRKGNVVIPYISYDDYEKIIKLEAYTYNIDESGNIKTTKVDKASIYKKKINAGITEMIIAFPEVKVGTVIEYRYKMERMFSSSMNDWYFQDDIPVKYSEYEVEMPSYLQFKEKMYAPVKPAVSEVKMKNEKGTDPAGYGKNEPTLKKSYIMQNIPSIKEEPFMGSVSDYRQRVEFLLASVDGYGYVIDMSTTWSLMVEGLNKYKYFGLQLEEFMPKTLRLVEEWKAIPDMKTRIKAVFKHIQETMTVDDNEGIFSYDGIEEAYNKKTGSTADINLLLLNLLMKVGVKAYPILFSTRDNGLVNTTYPDVNQFNTVMVYAAVDDKYWVMDASDKLSSCTLIPAQVVNSNGFVLQGAGGKWMEVLENKIKYKVFTAVKAEISADGKMTGDATVTCSGYAKRDRGSSWTKNKEEFKQKFFSIPDMTVNLDDIVVNTNYTDSLPLEQKVKFNCMLNRSGEYTYFTVNIFSGIDKNPFIAEQRISDIEYGYLQNYTLVGTFSIPEGYVIDAMPENISLTMPDKTIVFNRVMTANENQLNVRMLVDFKNSFYAVGDYVDFREFYKKLSSTLNEQVVIKKK